MCAAAAIFAGCTFFGGYPITPSTEIMQFLDREIWKYGGTVLQAEDEIAGIGAVVGASFAGKKAMTATSGPGMSLKTEMLGLASIAELPLVCVNVQRGGPSTGMPTKAEQSDLFQAAFSAHGDCLRPVLAPTSVGDMFGVTVEAFNLAEYYQTPVIVLSDQEIAQRKETVDPIDTTKFQLLERRRPTGPELTNYARFKLTESGISPISHPGLPGGNYLAAGIEHNELGRPTASGEMHARMNEKRFRKFNPLKNRRDLFTVEGDPDAPIGMVSWGSVAGVAREALRLAQAEGLQVKLLVPRADDQPVDSMRQRAPAMPASRVVPTIPSSLAPRCAVHATFGDLNSAWNAAQHLPAASLSTAEELRFRTWFSARAGTIATPNAQTVERHVVAEPGDIAAWDQLAELALANGDTHRRTLTPA